MMVFVLIITSIYLSYPIIDPDFFWHLKTGQWIWQHKSLPAVDPFTSPPIPPPSPQTEFILSSYWFSQLTLYGFYAIGEMSGIVVRRWIIAGISCAIFARWANLRNSSVTAVMMLGSVLILEKFPLDRPQFISFICFGALLVILFKFFECPDRWPLWRFQVSLSLLMVVWANMHAGFFVGLAILILCVVTEGCKFIHPTLSPLLRKDYKILLVATFTALAASFLNPNPINSIKMLASVLDVKAMQDTGNTEYMNVIETFKIYHNYVDVIILILMLLTAVVVSCSRQRKNLTWIGILLATGYMGCLHMRYMPFFLISATMFSMKVFETELIARRTKLFLYALLLAVTIYCVRDEAQPLRNAMEYGWVSPYNYPTMAADFIAANNLQGNVFTLYNWGGYMIWQLGPENKIFCDGRNLYVNRTLELNNSFSVASTHTPYWKELFDKYNIQIVVLPLFETSSVPITLTQSVRMDKDWVMVFARYNTAVFIRAV